MKIAHLLLIALTLTLISCNSGDNTYSSESEDAATTETVTHHRPMNFNRSYSIRYTLKNGVLTIYENGREVLLEDNVSSVINHQGRYIVFKQYGEEVLFNTHQGILFTSSGSCNISISNNFATYQDEYGTQIWNAKGESLKTWDYGYDSGLKITLSNNYAAFENDDEAQIWNADGVIVKKLEHSQFSRIELSDNGYNFFTRTESHSSEVRVRTQTTSFRLELNIGSGFRADGTRR